MISRVMLVSPPFHKPYSAKEFDSGILTVAGGPHATVEPEQCLNHCDIVVRQAGIPTVTGFFMVGNWGETIWDVAKTWYFVFSNNVDMVLTVCTPLPGTKFASLLKRQSYITDEIDWENVNWITPLNRTDKMPRWCIYLLYYLTVIFVHLPSTLFRGRGRKKKTRGLISNIIGYAYNKVRLQ